MARVLIVEDEPRMRDLLVQVLSFDGHDVLAAEDGTAGLAIAVQRRVDAAVVDVMLPGMDGFELCRNLRRYGLDLGVLLLTSRGDLEDRVSGLDSGADDYLTKPFEVAELRARVRALVRRQRRTLALVTVGDLELDPAATRARCGGTTLALSVKEFLVLLALAGNVGVTVPRAVLFDEVWGPGSSSDPAVVDQYVSHLRKRLSACGTPTSITTVRGVGYRLDGGR